MGFPLSTDIFGQLKWLIKQVKLLIYRVTKLEHGGGGGAQTIDQVLATGNTASDKKLVIEDFGVGAKYSIVGDLSGFGIGFTAEYLNGFGGRSQMAPGYSQYWDSAYSFTTMYQSQGINFSNVIDSDGITLKQYTNSANNISSAILATTRLESGSYSENGFHLNFIDHIYKIGGYGGNGTILNTYLEVNDAQGSVSTNINGTQKGLFVKETFQMLINNDSDVIGFTNNLGGNSCCIIGDHNGSQSGTMFVVNYGLHTIFSQDVSGARYGLQLDLSGGIFSLGDNGGDFGGCQLEIHDGNSTISTNLFGAKQGLFLELGTSMYTLGDKGNSGTFFGIATAGANKLIASGIRNTGNFFTPAGAIPIDIDGTLYYIELWQ